MPAPLRFARLLLPLAAAGLVLAWFQPLSDHGLSPGIAAAAQAEADEPPAGLTRDDWTRIRRSIQESVYHASRIAKPGEAPGLQASNRQQAYRTTFRQEGIEIVPQAPAGASWRLGLSVTGYGYEGDLRPLEPAEPQALKERVEYRRGPVTEWYVNRPGGLEQGFDLEEPQPRRAGPLVVAMAIQGDLDVSGSDSGASFARRSGETLVRYADLKAWDAEGRPLPSRLEAMDREIRLVVEAQAARFPITVDPTFIHEAQLFGHGDPIGEASDLFGWSTSVSGDTAVVGVRSDDIPGVVNAGSAYVFVRSGTTWTEQQMLVASDGAVGDDFGSSVSVSGDTVVVGAYSAGGGDAGAAYVFVRSGTTWTEQQKLLASDGAADDRLGSSVSVSGDTVVVGAVFDDTPGGVNAGSAYVFVRSGTTWTEQQKLLASDGAANDLFGQAVSAFGDTLLVGAPRAGGGDAGEVYVFVRSGTTWTEQQKLLASDGAAGDEFGCSVSISGDTAGVGAIGAGTPGGVDGGSAYVFVRSGTTWTQQQKLLASDAATGADFGNSVSVSGDAVVVGAPFDDTPAGEDAGSAYVFVRSGTSWTEQQKLVASDGAAEDVFGYSVSISGDTVVVGVPLADAGGSIGEAGAAVVFVRSGTAWTEQQKVLALDATAGDGFGYSASVSGDTVVIGAVFDGTPGALAGSAYVFVRSGTTWTEQQKLLASDGAAGDNFGRSVSVSGDTVVVGAPVEDNPGGTDAGTAYVFVRSGTTWTEQQKLLAPDGAANDAFGVSVSISGDTVVVGAYGDDIGGNGDVGSAYVFVRSGTTWAQQQKLPGLGGLVDWFGYSVSVSGDTVVVGVPLADAGGGSIADAGAAVVFVRSGTTWTAQQTLFASDPAASDYFGWSVSVSGDTAVVGSVLDDTPALETGSAYVFVRSGTTWSEQQKLVASDGAGGDGFGGSVSVLGDTVVVGASGNDMSAGSAYVFVRSGTTWSEQQKLLAPVGAANDVFGSSVSLSGDTVAIGASGDDTLAGADAGSAHVFRGLTTADLALTKTDGQTAAVPGEPLTYTIVASNAGPNVVTGATLTDLLPAALLGPTWTCSASPGSSCTASGSGSINDTVNLAVGGTATYMATGTVASGATGTLTNAASVAAPGGVPDPNPANNDAADTDTLTPESDLSVTKTDGQTTAVPGQPVTYTITAANTGPSDVTGATVMDAVPAALLGAMWTCAASPGSSCAPSGSGSISDTVNLLASGIAAYTLTGTVDPAATGTLVNTVTVAAPGGTTDPNAANNSATDTDTLLPVGLSIEGELAHGSQGRYDLAALPGPAPDEDVFRILQRPHASYEVLLDGASGDLGSGSGPLLERVAADGSTVLQGSSPAGAGGSRSLRWINAIDTPVADEFVRVRSAGCTTDCDAADVYRLGARETTGFIPRFNNSATQVTVLVLQNLGDEATNVDIRFWSGTGAPLGGPSVQTLGPRASYVLNTSALVPGSSGSITLANTGRYGRLIGKAVAVEPATGFTFDTAMAPRPR